MGRAGQHYVPRPWFGQGGGCSCSSSTALQQSPVDGYYSKYEVHERYTPCTCQRVRVCMSTLPGPGRYLVDNTKTQLVIPSPCLRTENHSTGSLNPPTKALCPSTASLRASQDPKGQLSNQDLNASFGVARRTTRLPSRNTPENDAAACHAESRTITASSADVIARGPAIFGASVVLGMDLTRAAWVWRADRDCSHAMLMSGL